MQAAGLLSAASSSTSLPFAAAKVLPLAASSLQMLRPAAHAQLAGDARGGLLDQLAAEQQRLQPASLGPSSLRLFLAGPMQHLGGQQKRFCRWLGEAKCSTITPTDLSKALAPPTLPFGVPPDPTAKLHANVEVCAGPTQRASRDSFLPPPPLPGQARPPAPSNLPAPLAHTPTHRSAWTARSCSSRVGAASRRSTGSRSAQAAGGVHTHSSTAR